MVIGLLIGNRIHALKKQQTNSSRFYTVTLSAALIGGLLADLANGSPDFVISFVNLFISGVAVVVSLFCALLSYASILTKNFRQTLDAYGKILRLRLQTIRNK